MYRIMEHMKYSGEHYYTVEHRFLFLWLEITEHDCHGNAFSKKFLTSHDAKNYIDEKRDSSKPKVVFKSKV